MSDLYRHLCAATLLVLGVCGATWQVVEKPPSLERLQRGWASVYGAYLDPSFLGSMRARSRRNRWGSALGTLVTVSGGAALLWLTDLPPTLAVTAVPSVSLVLGSLRRLTDTGREFVVPGSSSAVARPRRVVLSDYVSPLAQLLTWVSVSVVILAALVALNVHDRLGGTATVVVAAGATAILAEAVFVAWFGKVLCERPTPAVDASHLYLQDAWRACALNGVHFQLRLSALLFAQAVSMAISDLGSRLGTGLLASALVVLLAALLLRTQHFRTRLWPTLLPGQILLPGQPVPPRVGANA